MSEAVSEVGRYRRIFPRLWRHPGFLGLTKGERELTLYLLTGPQSNRIGLFHLSIATASEDLDVSVETIRRGLPKVSVAFGWIHDSKARVFYIPSWWRWNHPANENVLAGNLKDLQEIPASGLVEAFVRNLSYLPERLHPTFVEGCRQRIPQRSPIQDQEQEQYQEQVPAGWRKGRTSGANGSGVARSNDDRDGTEVSPQLVKLAHETIRLTSPNLSIDELVEAFLNQHQNTRRRQAVAALNEALSQRRSASLPS